MSSRNGFIALSVVTTLLLVMFVWIARDPDPCSPPDCSVLVQPLQVFDEGSSQWVQVPTGAHVHLTDQYDHTRNIGRVIVWTALPQHRFYAWKLN